VPRPVFTKVTRGFVCCTTYLFSYDKLSVSENDELRSTLQHLMLGIEERVTEVYAPSNVPQTQLE